jgi:hypothetical protein
MIYDHDAFNPFLSGPVPLQAQNNSGVFFLWVIFIYPMNERYCPSIFCYSMKWFALFQKAGCLFLMGHLIYPTNERYCPSMFCYSMKWFVLFQKAENSVNRRVL